jgi:hypothetical protein
MADRKPGRVKSPRRLRKVRDYAAEYARRIARALSLGLTRTQARGHPRAYEGFVSKRKRSTLGDERLQRALRTLRQEQSLKAAAKAARVSPERLKHAASSTGAIHKEGRRWVVNPHLARRMPLYSRGRQIRVIVNGQSASRVGEFMAAVGKFVVTNDRSLLAPFEGQSVTDIAGRRHPFETNPNVLHRLTSAGGETFEQVYRIIV